MQEASKKIIEKAIISNREAIKQNGPKMDLLQNPDMLLIHNAKDKIQINLLLSQLQKQLSELLPFVKKIKLHIVDITENTHICAIYLLLCNVFDVWLSFFILAKEGKSSAAGSLIRVIKEGIMQVDLFSTEALKGDYTNLNKWFGGEIIEHGKGREKVSNFLEGNLLAQEGSLKNLSTHIYQIESQASHNAYETILESVSPFSEDYDFDGYTEYYRTIAWLRYAVGSLEATNITLKMVYTTVINDEEAWKKLDDILIKYNPEIYKK